MTTVLAIDISITRRARRAPLRPPSVGAGEAAGEPQIPRLAREFLREFSARHHGRALAFSVEAMRALESYRWPGNVRELREAVERGVTHSGDEIISLGDLPEDIRMYREHSPAPRVEPTPQGQSVDSLARSRQAASR